MPPPPASQSSYRGTAVTYTLQLASVDNNNPFTSSIALSATGLPAGATATFAPASVIPGTKLVASTLTVQLPSLTARNHGEANPLTPAVPQRPVTLAFSVAALACLFAGRKRHRLPLLLLLGLLSVAGAGLLSGCGATRQRLCDPPPAPTRSP